VCTLSLSNTSWKIYHRYNSWHRALGACRSSSSWVYWTFLWRTAVIEAAAAVPNIIRTVVTLSTQSYGAVEAVSQLRQGCSILLIHGTDDDILWPSCSSSVYNKANNPKKIILYEGAKHGLEEAGEQVHQVIFQWLVEHL
jgi:cephalosporin-C deacetylase-like acetyl esterase